MSDAGLIQPVFLGSGAVFLAEPAPGSRSFAAGLWFSTGSRHEAPHERGFSHFLEHMMFKGTSRFDAFGLSRTIERTGGYVNAFTERDCVCLHCTVPAADWELALDILADMAFGSTLPPEEFDREKKVILSEILQVEDDPEEKSHDAFLERLWPGDPASARIAGSVEDVTGADRGALEAFYRKHFSPGRMVAAVSGPVPADMAASALERAIAKAIGGRMAPAAEPVSLGTPRPTRLKGYTRAPAAQVFWYEGIQLEPPFIPDDFSALTALNGIIGETSSSRLFQRLRERQGLCYSVYSAFSLVPTECLWMAQATVPSAMLGDCVAAMDEEIDRLALDGPQQDECEDARTRLVGSFDLAMEDPDFRMRRLARTWMAEGSVPEARVEREGYGSLQDGRILEMCRRLLAGRERACYAYGKVRRMDARRIGLEEI